MKRPIRIVATFEPSPTNFPAYDIRTLVTVGDHEFACNDRLSMEAVSKGRGILAWSIKHVCDELLRFAEREFNESGKKRIKYEELPDFAFASWVGVNRIVSGNVIDESACRYAAPMMMHGQAHRSFVRGSVDKLTYYEDDNVIYESAKAKEAQG